MYLATLQSHKMSKFDGVIYTFITSETINLIKSPITFLISGDLTRQPKHRDLFFFFFWIQVYCPLRQGLTSDFTFDYATLWLPVPVSPLLPWPSSASSQGSPWVITPHEDPAQKHCSRTHHIGMCASIAQIEWICQNWLLSFLLLLCAPTRLCNRHDELVWWRLVLSRWSLWSGSS